MLLAGEAKEEATVQTHCWRACTSLHTYVLGVSAPVSVVML